LRRGAHPEDTGLSTFERPRPLSDGVGIRQQTTGSPQQVVTLGGDLNAPPDAIEEPDVQLVLEGTDLTRQGRLTQIQSDGGPGEAAGVDDGDEGAQVSQVHQSCTQRIDYMSENALDASRRRA
jgi:hypothetical protein